MVATDSFVGEGLVDSPYEELRTRYEYLVEAHRKLMTEFERLQMQHWKTRRELEDISRHMLKTHDLTA